MSTTVEYNPLWGPKLSLTKGTLGGYTAVFTIPDNAPTRGTTAEELVAGITSLDPPTVTVAERETSARTHRALIDACKRAVSSAAYSTKGDTPDGIGGIGGLIMLRFRVAKCVRDALRKLGEDI